MARDDSDEAAAPAVTPPPPAAVRGRIYDSIAETIGLTPLVRFNRLPAEAGCRAEIVGKLEFFNPLASVKDRIGVSMIEAAEAIGRIAPGRSVLVEPTSGNTGIALAFVAAAKGYRLILTMPESMSIERRRILLLLGSELELTPAEKGIPGALARAEELVEEIDGAVMLQQFANPASPAIHRLTTAEEIWRDTDGAVDAIVCGVGTGGTVPGIGQVLKPRLPALQLIGVEPAASAVLSGAPAAPHRIQGIGAGFVPEVLDRSVIDELIAIGDETAFETVRQTARLEGIPVGISSGAAIAAALQVGAREGMAGKRILVIVPSFAERYLSTDLFAGL